jgi:hypothetical protein
MKISGRLICYSALILMVLQGTALSDAGDQKKQFFPEDLEWIVFEVAGEIIEKEKNDLEEQKIKETLLTRLRGAGIQSKIVTKKEIIENNRFLKVRIHSIMLERQVYLCSFEIFQTGASKDNDAILKYSNVTTRARYVQSIINGLTDQLLRDLDLP